MEHALYRRLVWLERDVFERVGFIPALAATQGLLGTVLKGADMDGANLEGADLTGAHLEGVDLALVKGLEMANLSDVYYDDRTSWPVGFQPPPRQRLVD